MTAELSGRLGRARFLRLGWFKPSATTAPAAPVAIGRAKPNVVPMLTAKPKVIEQRAAT